MKINRKIYSFISGLILVAFTLPKTAHSQYRPWNFNHFHVAVQGGVAWPYDRFGTGHNLKFASYVDKGYNVTLQGVYFYTPNYGFGINLILNTHPVDNKKLAEAYLKKNSAYTGATATVDPFYMPIFTMGMVFQIPLNEYFAFTGALQAGMQTVIKPAGDVLLTTVFSTVPITETGVTQSKFVIYYKFGAQIKVAKSVHIAIDAAYTGATYQMEYERNSESVSEPQHIGDVMYRTGIVFKFD